MVMAMSRMDSWRVHGNPGAAIKSPRNPYLCCYAKHFQYTMDIDGFMGHWFWHNKWGSQRETSSCTGHKLRLVYPICSKRKPKHLMKSLCQNSSPLSKCHRKKERWSSNPHLDGWVNIWTCVSLHLLQFCEMAPGFAWTYWDRSPCCNPTCNG